MTGSFHIAGIPDAVGRFVESLPDILEGAADRSAFWQARQGTLLMCVPRIGTFRVTGGLSIEICPSPDADPAAVELCLYGAARAALLHQRGELPLHATTLVPPGGERALAICGDSGAGKSTLAVELSRRGWSLVADDTTRLQWTGSQPIAWPSDRGVKLWEDACHRFGIETHGLRHVRQDMEKFYLDVRTCSEPVVLGTVVELIVGEGSLQRVTTLTQRMSLLSRHAFRAGQVAALGVQRAHAQIVAHIASTCRVGQLPGARITPISELADHVEEAARWQAV